MKTNSILRGRLPARIARYLVTTALAGAAAIIGVSAMPSPAAAGTDIAREYYHRNWGGDIYRLYSETNNYRCTSSLTSPELGIADIPDHFNDEISSFKVYANCRAKHFQNNGYEGVRTGWHVTSSYIGDVMNDRTSSIQYT